MPRHITAASLCILASTCLTPAVGTAGNGVGAIPFGFGATIGAMQQMQQQQYLVQQRQNVIRQQAAAAWSQLGPTVLGCIAQNYQINGPQFGYYYIVFPNDARYVGMVRQCSAMAVQEQQRQRDLAVQERQQEAERQQQALQEQQAPRFMDRDPSHPGALGPGEWVPHGYRETRLTDPVYREQLRQQREAQQRQQQITDPIPIFQQLISGDDPLKAMARVSGFCAGMQIWMINNNNVTPQRRDKLSDNTKSIELKTTSVIYANANGDSDKNTRYTKEFWYAVEIGKQNFNNVINITSEQAMNLIGDVCVAVVEYVSIEDFTQRLHRINALYQTP